MPSAAIRIKEETKIKLEQLLRQANKDRAGRRIKVDDVLCFSLGLIVDEHIEAIRNNTLTNKDRMELLYLKISKEKRGITRDEFFGMLLGGNASH